jgi:hypothetical protein
VAPAHIGKRENSDGLNGNVGRWIGCQSTKRRDPGIVVVDAAQCKQKITGRLETTAYVFLETAAHDAIEGKRDGGASAAARWRVFAQNGADFVRGTLALEGSPTRDHLVYDRAEGKEIAALINRVTTSLLGRHIADGPHHRTWLGVTEGRRRRLRTVGKVQGLVLGKSKIENLVWCLRPPVWRGPLAGSTATESPTAGVSGATTPGTHTPAHSGSENKHQDHEEKWHDP